MVPPKKRALKARDNDIDLNIRLGTNHFISIIIPLKE